MSTPSVARASRNGQTARPHTTIVPLLAVKVDQLHRLRKRLAQAQAAERMLTQDLMAAMAAHGLTRFAGAQAVATIGAETLWRPVAELTRDERRAGGWADLHPDDAVALQASSRRPVLRITVQRGA